MPGETNLAALLAELKPMLADEEHGFATIPMGAGWPQGLVPVATFAEAEGASVIALVSIMEGIGLDHEGGWAKITIGANSALSAVGLTAKIASALAETGISANIVAAYHHDHVFVPWARRDEAMAVLENLSKAQE
ncbi:ACT domain-containing protein [Parasphingopyxis algicola]|uniref:ACT domain-containing protein n=1 Tax=Parasphingopyxis algicola TaxID=2026624 RepID=UPI0015A48E63|nr:ACT domain-containing protein [Parasphingopyxis algicola]QLC24707.1 ACT domain-containing protein [Parasphingopyxis algicola]